MEVVLLEKINKLAIQKESMEEAIEQAQFNIKEIEEWIEEAKRYVEDYERYKKVKRYVEDYEKNENEEHILIQEKMDAGNIILGNWYSFEL